MTGFNLVFQNCAYDIRLRPLILPYAIKIQLVVQQRRDGFFSFPISLGEMVTVSFNNPVSSDSEYVNI